MLIEKLCFYISCHVDACCISRRLNAATAALIHGVILCSYVLHARDAGDRVTVKRQKQNKRQPVCVKTSHCPTWQQLREQHKGHRQASFMSCDASCEAKYSAHITFAQASRSVKCDGLLRLCRPNGGGGRGGFKG